MRARIVDILGELASYDVDGLALLFNRQPPFVGTEATDRLAPATALLEEVRAAIPDRPVTAWVFGTREQNIDVGLDVETWVRRGLVDTVAPYSSAARGFSWGEAWTDPASIGSWTDLVRGTGVALAPNVMPRDMDGDGHRRQALRLYWAGVENLAFWDTHGRVPLFGGALRDLGHRDRLEAWSAAGEPPEQLPQRRITEVAGWRFEGIPE